MAFFGIRIKQPRKRCLEPGLLGKKHIAAGFIVLAIVITMAFLCLAAKNDISWSEDELAFMKEHPVIRVGVDPGFVPFEFIDADGEYKGIAADYLALISERTGLKFEVLKEFTWPEVYNMALAWDVDVLPAVGGTSERQQSFLLSEPYYYFKRVIVTKNEDASITGMDDLDGLNVAVQRNSSHHSYLLSYPKVNLSLYDSVEAALAAVATGGEKAFVGNLATTSYLIRTNGLTNLRLVSFEAEKQQAICFAVRKDWPQLVDIINKTLHSIPESEKLVISKKWVDLDTHIDYTPIIQIVSVIGAFIAVILFVSFFWIARLKKEISRRKQIQLDLEKAKHEADEANKFKSSFMARMSHEIRTPLNAIMGMSYLLKKTEISLTQSMYVDRITQAANSMISIIDDILDYTKIEAGKAELEIAPFSMDQVIHNVVNIVSYKIEEQGIGFRLAKDPLVPNWFFGDSKRVEQVLLNVLNNAVKFTKEGEVSLDIRLIAKEGYKYHISFTVKDTGIGMTKEQVDKLFIPFKQADSSINRRFGGFGLGLSIVKNLVDMMGGRIEVFSTPGEGSTFVIYLSLSVDKEKEAVYAKALSGNYLKDIRALILEKSGANINMIENYLGSLGMDCEITSSETSALNMLEAANGKFAKPFDLFIIDYDTPAEGGFNFVAKMRNSSRIVKMPKLIMLFPMMRYDLFDKLGEYEVDMGIGKPIIPSILLNGILDIFNLKAVSKSKCLESKKTVLAKLEKPYNVLLAEDNKTNQLIAKLLLEQTGINPIIAGDGKEAVELYKERMADIDLILMDLHMPVMDGYEASEKIRELSDKVPIVAMTADVVFGVRERCEKSGIFHYISKPFNPDHFIQTVTNIILENESAAAKDTNVLDRELGIKNMGGDDKLYHKVLREYYNENLDTLGRLEAALHEKRHSDAAQIVHKMKGSTGSIGAKPLYEAAMSLQKALEEEKEEEIEPLYERFSHLLKKLLDELK